MLLISPPLAERGIVLPLIDEVGLEAIELEARKQAYRGYLHGASAHFYSMDKFMGKNKKLKPTGIPDRNEDMGRNMS